MAHLLGLLVYFVGALCFYVLAGIIVAYNVHEVFA